MSSIVTKKFLSRRTILRGLGASLALPLLDGMVPAFAGAAHAATQAPKRLGAFYAPNGVAMPFWLPKSFEPGFALSPILQLARAVPRQPVRLEPLVQ